MFCMCSGAPANRLLPTVWCCSGRSDWEWDPNNVLSVERNTKRKMSGCHKVSGRWTALQKAYQQENQRIQVQLHKNYVPFLTTVG